MRNIFNFSNTLFWKISGVFLLILFVFSGITFYLFTYLSEMYFRETVQKLNSNVAQHISKHNKCFIDGEVNKKVLKDVFHNVMVINPSIEVYLLDTSGKILTYYAPDKIIKLEKVPLRHINTFIESGGKKFITGIDPKNPKHKNPFSAAKVVEDNKHKGYIYVILNGEEYSTISQMLQGSYFLRYAFITLGIIFAAALVIGIISIVIITRKISRIAGKINEFKSGNPEARIDFKTEGELGIIARSFNEMADKILEDMERIKNIDRSRRELIAYISHDLRTPIASIRGYTDTLLMKQESLSRDEQLKYINTISRSIRNLSDMVDDLFELSKLESGRITPQKELISLPELVQDIYRKNRVIAEQKNIDIKLEGIHEMPMIEADIALMERAIQNLVDNAVKYSPEGSEVSISLAESGKRIRFVISNEGAEIEDIKLAGIFENYVRGNSASSENGFGLGLAIVKKILELHEIDIHAESENGKTVFYFDVPHS